MNQQKSADPFCLGYLQLKLPHQFQLEAVA